MLLQNLLVRTMIVNVSEHFHCVGWCAALCDTELSQSITAHAGGTLLPLLQMTEAEVGEDKCVTQCTAQLVSGDAESENTFF